LFLSSLSHNRTRRYGLGIRLRMLNNAFSNHVDLRRAGYGRIFVQHGFRRLLSRCSLQLVVVSPSLAFEWRRAGGYGATLSGNLAGSQPVKMLFCTGRKNNK
jgi:hypothetical protein